MLLPQVVTVVSRFFKFAD